MSRPQARILMTAGAACGVRTQHQSRRRALCLENTPFDTVDRYGIVICKSGTFWTSPTITVKAGSFRVW